MITYSVRVAERLPLRPTLLRDLAKDDLSIVKGGWISTQIDGREIKSIRSFRKRAKEISAENQCERERQLNSYMLNWDIKEYADGLSAGLGIATTLMESFGRAFPGQHASAVVYMLPRGSDTTLHWYAFSTAPIQELLETSKITAEDLFVAFEVGDVSTLRIEGVRVSNSVEWTQA